MIHLPASVRVYLCLTPCDTCVRASTVCTRWYGSTWSWTPSPDTCFIDRSITPVTAQEIRRVRITHVFHPLNGRQFDLIEHRVIFAESVVYFHDDTGELREIPAAWTDFVALDPFVEVAAGRSPLHAERLLELADLVSMTSALDAGDVK